MPSWEVESNGLGDGDIREHGSDDAHDFFLNLGIRKSLDPDGEIALG